MKNFIAIFLLLTPLELLTQNLVPNGSFEQSSILVYENPFEAFNYLNCWYEADTFPHNPQYDGSPDLFDQFNQIPATTPSSYWNNAAGAADGEYHVGISNSFSFEGYLSPEAMATPLTIPLETGIFYYLTLEYRNKGIAGYANREPILCVPEIYRQIEVTLNPDSILVTIDVEAQISFTNASKTIALHTTEMERNQPGTWHRTGTCFQADGQEKFLGISTTTGRFTVNPPCIIYEEHFDVFHTFYMDIDNVQLHRLPEAFYLTDTICEGKSQLFNLAKMTKLPPMQNKVAYHWEDGTIDSVNYISTAGTYLIEVELDCIRIPIILEVISVKCTPNLFIPNAFSPNGDGVNDELYTFLSVDLPVLDFDFQIFNRWGALLFASDNPNLQWDGYFKNELVDRGVYIWRLNYSVIPPDGIKKTYQESGDVLVIR